MSPARPGRESPLRLRCGGARCWLAGCLHSRWASPDLPQHIPCSSLIDMSLQRAAVRRCGFFLWIHEITPWRHPPEIPSRENLKSGTKPYSWPHSTGGDLREEYLQGVYISLSVTLFLNKNKNLAIANRSRVSCAHKVTTGSMSLKLLSKVTQGHQKFNVTIP